MSGGAYEYVAAYINNGNSNLATNGSSLVNADLKYKDIYAVSNQDARLDNYQANSKVYGDAMWDTSSHGDSASSWYSDYSYMAHVNYPWIQRGCAYNYGTGAGVYAFSFGIGTPSVLKSFHAVLLVE